MTEKPPVLEMEGIEKSYGRHPALRGFSMTVTQGKFVGVLGPNGAGKSTLFQIIAGLFMQDAGRVEVFGMRHGSQSSKILRRLGVVFQSRSIDLDMTAEANLRFHGGLFGYSGDDLRHRIDRVLGQLDIVGMRRRMVRAMSGGEQRRVEVARALLNEPELLIMDEPSAGLDPTSRAALVAHMRDLSRNAGVAILWATHLVDELAEADCIVIMSKGATVASGPAAQVINATGARDLTETYTLLTGGNIA
jgi:ABC-2 type transport system ATP-binding protein